MAELRQAIRAIVEANQPCSVRNVYYVGIGILWPKDQRGSRKQYKNVVRLIGDMRETGSLPFGWITDSTRYVRIDTMYESLTDAMDRTREQYRRNLWAKQPRRVEVWAESDSISGVIDPVTRALGIGLFSCRGQASKTFAHSSAMAYVEIGKPVTILYVGDWDPTGLAIPRSLEERLNRYSKGSVPIDFRRVAITAEDLTALDLTSHEVNASDPNYRRYAEACALVGQDPQESVEVEAFPAPALRDRLEAQIYDLVDDPESWNRELDLEEHDLAMLADMAARGWSV